MCSITIIIAALTILLYYALIYNDFSVRRHDCISYYNAIAIASPTSPRHPPSTTLTASEEGAEVALADALVLALALVPALVLVLLADSDATADPDLLAAPAVAELAIH